MKPRLIFVVYFLLFIRPILTYAELKEVPYGEDVLRCEIYRNEKRGNCIVLNPSGQIILRYKLEELSTSENSIAITETDEKRKSPSDRNKDYRILNKVIYSGKRENLTKVEEVWLYYYQDTPDRRESYTAGKSYLLKDKKGNRVSACINTTDNLEAKPPYHCPGGIKEIIKIIPKDDNTFALYKKKYLVLVNVLVTIGF